MTTVENGTAEDDASPSAQAQLPKLHWGQILAISIFWFALNFHWSAIGIIILPSQIYKLVGSLHQGEALAFVLVPGAFVSLIANPFFGLLSDKTRGRLAIWGRRRPYILIGTLVNMLGLVWMAVAPDVTSLALAYILVQFFNNAAQAPFHALLPDVVPQSQRGLASGVMGLLTLSGNIAGVLAAGMFIDAKKPLPAYQQSLWLMYGLIMVVMLIFMLVTILTVNERVPIASNDARSVSTERRQLPSWLNRSLVVTIIATLLAAAVVWGAVWLWNRAHMFGVQINNDVLQVLLEVVATIGILRIFGFRPRRYPDFTWVLVTRLLMMLGIYTIQTFLQYYMRDVVHASHPEQQTTNFAIVVSLTSLVSALCVGWLSDRYGRKRMVYFSGGFMALVGLMFVVTHDLLIVTLSGAIFGLGYGAYQSVDWALVADVLPSKETFARDMGVWNISLSLPQVIAPVLGGPLLDVFTRSGQTVLGYQILFAMAIVYCLLGTVAVRYIRGVAR